MIGDVTLAAYEPLLGSAEASYAEQLRNAEARDHEAELWVAVAPDDREVLGTVTLCREGSPWREIGFADEGEFRMLAVAPHAQGQGVGEALARHVHRPLPRGGRGRGGALEHPAHGSPRTGSTSGSASAAAPSGTGSRCPASSCWPSGWSLHELPAVHGHRRRHRARRRLRQPPRPRHAPAARVVRGGHLRRDRVGPRRRARRRSAPASSSSTSPPARSAPRSR